MSVFSHIQGFNLGAKVTLYELDLTKFGLGIIRLAPGTAGSRAVSYGGEIYAPHPIEATGFGLAAGGSLPRPEFAVANLDNSFTALVEQNDDLQGGTLTRIRTYERYLDGGAEPDGEARLPIEVFTLSQKMSHDMEEIHWACAAAMDQEGVELPGRQIIRDYCDHTTREWTGTKFDYTNVTCPYAGAPRDVDGNPCAGSEEIFSKRLQTCCYKRFGKTSRLPSRAFPGVARLAGR